jgi:membrane-bound serine protease (ClpP class)
MTRRCAVALAIAVVMSAPVVAAPPLVYVAAVDGVIDLGLAPYLARVVREAETAGARALILEVNTFGGRVDAAVAIRDTLLRARVPTVAFVDKRAISAGALISLAAEKIVMADGATIGAATPVGMGPQGATQAVSEKTVSYVRKEFRATADSRGRPPLIAEAMVDADVEIPGLVAKGKLLTLTTEEALAHRVADFRADDLAAVLAQLGIADAEIRRPAPSWAETIVRFLTHPVVSSLLMTVGMVGIIVELRTPGFGVPGALGIASLGLFFWGHWLVRLAGWEEILLVGLGLAFLALELFVIPGFGVTGIIGIVAILAGLGMTMVGGGATWNAILVALGRVAFSLLAALALSLVALRFLPRLPWGRRLVLADELPVGGGFTPVTEDPRRWLGKRGTTLSPLRPAGIADIDGERIDVVSTGAYVDAGEPVEVIRVEGPRIVVRVRTPTERGHP